MTVGRKRRATRVMRGRPGDFSFKVFVKKHGVGSFMALCLIAGMIMGAVCEKTADEQLYRGLDFLFTTNLQERLEQDFFSTFCACFASNFIFTATLFLLGITPWGAVLIPFVFIFKGFGVGLSGSYLVQSHFIMGILFYVSVVLPGVFAFCLALIGQGGIALINSKNLFFLVFKGGESTSINQSTRLYLNRSLIILVISLGCAVLDTLLWCVLAPLFGFI